MVELAHRVGEAARVRRDGRPGSRTLPRPIKELRKPALGLEIPPHHHRVVRLERLRHPVHQRPGEAKRRAEAAWVRLREVPSPGRVERDGRVEPASYMNFAITSRLVVVPLYGTPHDADGVAAIAELFPDRDVVGIMADAVLAGGGSFHCASQQMPALIK